MAHVVEPDYSLGLVGDQLSVATEDVADFYEEIALGALDFGS